MQNDWLLVAQNLPDGHSERAICCGSSKSAIISNKDRRWSFHCFRCGTSESKRQTGKTLSELMRQYEPTDGSLDAMPSDYVLLPPNKAEWVLKYGIDLNTAHFYGIGYSAEQDRIILPVGSVRSPELIQARALRPEVKPKYLTTPGANAGAALFKNEMVHAESNKIVLVEDILSAIKIGLAGYPAISILGTNLSDGKLARLLELPQASHWYIWMDTDEPGQKAARVIEQRLRTVAKLVVRVTADSDPKECTRDEITEELQLHNTFEFM